MKTSLFGIFLIAFSIIICNAQDTPDFDYGHVEDSTYLNSFFNFQMTLPTGWVVQTKEQMDALAKTGKALVAGDDENLKAVVKASEINTANLLIAFQFERGSAVEYNPSIMLVAENTRNAPGIKTGRDYLFQARRLLESSQFKYDRLDDEFAKEEINGKDFYKMNAEVKYLGLDIKQTYYSTVVKGFSFNVIISFVNDQQKLELINSIQSMKF